MKSIFLFFSLFFSILGFSQNPNERALDKLFKLLHKENLAMGNIAIYQDGYKTYTQSFGYKDIELRDRGNPHTLYRVGALTHIFTTVIIMQLIKEGQLSLQSTLAEFYPDLPQASKISIKQLLCQCQKSNPTNSVSYKERTPIDNKQALLRTLRKKDSLNHGFNFVLLSFIAEDLTGEKLPALIAHRISSPLQLQQTRFATTIKSKKNEALPYLYKHGNWQSSRKEPITPLLKDQGQLISTAQEIAKFYSALFTEKLTAPSSLTTMTSQNTGCGFGLAQLHFRDKINFRSRGNFNNFQTIAVYFPKEKTSIALTINASRISPDRILTGVFNLYFGYDYNLEKFPAS